MKTRKPEFWGTREHVLEYRDRLATEARELVAAAEREHRALTPEEELTHDEVLSEIRAASGRLTEMDRRDGTAGLVTPSGLRIGGGGEPRALAVRGDGSGALSGARETSLGSLFVRSAAFSELQSRLPYDGPLRMPPVEFRYDVRAALLEPTAGWAPLVQTPPPVPGLAAPRVAGLFAQAAVTSGSVGFLQDQGQASAAAPVAQGVQKPELSLALPQILAPLATIAVWTSTSVQALEDAEGLRAFIDSILLNDVLDRLDQQVLAGTGTPPEMLGLLNTPGIGTLAPTAGQITPDVLLAAIGQVLQESGLPADGIVLNPADFIDVLTLKAAPSGSYLTGTPFTVTPTPTFWGLRVVPSAAMPAGTALVGAFRRGGILYARAGARVEASTEHLDFFTKNLVALRAELRAVLAVLRSKAFVKVTLPAG